MSREFAALIIDLKKSRAYSNKERYSIQYYIMDVINLLNRLYRKDIVRDVDFSAGDEIQGLFASPEAAYLYYRMFSMWLHPVEFRAGIGVGGWDIQIDGKGTTWQDGPAYHNARYAIENADEAEGYPVLYCSGHRSDITINTIIGGAASIMAKQSPYQNQLMLLTEFLFPICNDFIRSYEVASPSDIAEILHRKNYLDHEYERFHRPLPIDRITCDFIEVISPINAEDIRYENEFFITSGRKRGIPTKLASMMDISRQMVDKALKAGNIFTARNMAIAALNEMTDYR